MRFRACPVLIALLGPAACAVADEPATDSAAPADETLAIRGFTETFSPWTFDVGHWALTTNDLRARVIEPTGGNPGGYLHGEVASPIPTWSTASRRFDPEAGSDTIFVGNYLANDIRRISADLCVYQAGSWSASRTVTLQLVRWDVANATILLEATYSLPDIPDVPDGWRHYKFRVDARSATIPPGWQLEHGDGSPATDADWAVLMHQIDVVGFGFWKPGYMYPALGLWELGIDNIHVGTW